MANGEWPEGKGAAMTIFVTRDQPVLIWTGEVALDGLMSVPRESEAVVLIAGLVSTPSQPGYRALAARLHEADFATVIADLLTPEEQQFDSRTGHFRLDLPFLSNRVRQIARWIEKNDETGDLPLAFFGTSVAGTAGILATASGAVFHSLVLNRPRIDLAGEAAHRVEAPILLLQDADHFAVRALRADGGTLSAPHRLDIVPGAADILQDVAAAESIASHAVGWYRVNTPQLVA